MRFSICIPAYKVERYLPKCLDSILSQSYKDYEIVVVDDGSPDNTGKIADEYALKFCNIRVIHKQNEGLLHARISAMREAKGEYYLFLDSDDSFMPGSLEILDNFINIHKSEVVIFNWVNTFADGRIIKSRRFGDNFFIWEDKTSLMRKFFESSSLNSICCKAIKNGLIPLNELEKLPRVQMSEDRILSFYPLIYGKKIGYCPEFIYNYNRASEVSMTRKFNKSFYASQKVIYNLFIECDDFNTYVSKDEINVNLLKNVSSYIVYGRAMVEENEMYYSFLDSLLNDELFMRVFCEYLDKIPLNFRWPLKLLHYRKYATLLASKKILSAISRKI